MLKSRRRLRNLFGAAIDFVLKRDSDLPGVTGVRIAGGATITPEMLNALVLERVDRLETNLAGKSVDRRRQREREQD